MRIEANKHPARTRRILVSTYLAFMATIFVFWPLAALWTS
jgi:hypothetical protein